MKDFSLTRREVIENIQEGFVVLDNDLAIVDMNLSSCNTFRATLDEIVGVSVREIIPEWDSLVKNDSDVEGITGCETKINDQTYRLRISNIRDDDGLNSGYVLFLQVISKKREAQTDLDITRKDYHAIMDSLQDSYFEADRDGIITYANQGLVTELGGKYKTDLIGKHFRYFTDRKSVRDVYERFKKLYESKQPLKPFEFYYRHKDGKPLIGEAYISPIMEDGEVIGTRGFIRNITSRVQAEKALRETSFNLGERVKELNCLYGISALVETPGITLDGILQRTVDLIPPAWHYPENTSARIILEEQEYKTKNYAASARMMSVDILINGIKNGVVEVHYLDERSHMDDGEGPFLKEERNLINAIAERLGQITERQLQADRMATLYQVGLATTSSLDMDAILVTIYEQCHQAMNANVFFVALSDGEKDEINYPIFFDKGKKLEPFSVPLDTGLGGWIIRNNRPFLCDDLVARKDQLPIKMHRTGGQITRSFAGVPLLRREGVIGAIAIQSYRVGDYNEEDVQLLTTIAAQAAGAIDNAQLYEAEQVAKERLGLQNKEIQEQKDLLDGLLQHSPLAIVLNDLESKITVVNPAFEKLFGYSKGEAIGNDLDDILSTPEIVESMRTLSRKSLKEEQDAYAEGKRKRKDGSLVDVELFTTPYYVGDRQYGYMVFYNDISQRLQAEVERDQTHASFRSILDSLQDPYFEADKTGFITYANLGFVKVIGYDVRDDVIGIHFRNFTHRSAIRDIYRNFKLVYDTKQPATPFDFRSRRKDGTFMIGDAYISPIIEGNEVIGTRGVIRDITVRVKAEEALRVAKNEAETRAEELATINRLSATVNRSLNLEDILQSVCHELTGVFPIRNAGIALLNADGSSQEIVAFHSVNTEEVNIVSMIIPLQRNDASWEAMETKKPVVIHDALADVRLKAMWDVYQRRGTRAIMIIPLLTRGTAIGTIGMPAKDPKHIFSDNEIELAETIASQIAAAVDNARLYAQTETALDVAKHDLEIGRQIQSGFFPEFLPEIPGWEIATYYQAARQVAGDFYDIFQFRNSNFTTFIIADVCDKGVGAALFMVLFRSLLRAFSEREVKIDNVQDQLLDIILSTNKFVSVTHGKSNMFATMFVGILDPDSGTFSYVNGGHDPPVVLDKSGKVIHKLLPTGPAVGLFPDLNFSVEQFKFNKGDILFGFTDGTTDARDYTGKFFGEEKLLETLYSPWPSAFSMLYDLNSIVQEHIGEQDQYDDITQFSLRRKIAADDNIHSITRMAVLENLGELRDFAEAAAINSSLSHDHAFAFKLAAEEICHNILKYGYEGQEPGNIGLSFECEKEKAILTITDDGKYFSPDQVDTPDIEASWEDRQNGGLGVFFVKEFMDNVSYNQGEDNGNILVLEKNISTNDNTGG